jgi:hypothetical protein
MTSITATINSLFAPSTLAAIQDHVAIEKDPQMIPVEDYYNGMQVTIPKPVQDYIHADITIEEVNAIGEALEKYHNIPAPWSIDISSESYTPGKKLTLPLKFVLLKDLT